MRVRKGAGLARSKKNDTSSGSEEQERPKIWVCDKAEETRSLISRGCKKTENKLGEIDQS